MAPGSVRSPAALGVTRAAPRRRWSPLLVLLVLIVVGAVWVVRANRVSTVARHAGSEAGLIEIVEGDREPIRVMISPARRAEGATVTLNGLPVAHPPGPIEGELVVDLSSLGVGRHEIEVKVPRPTWRAQSTTLVVEVR